MELLDDLIFRGLVKDCSDIDGLRERLKTPITLYCGFDPTADKLHVGHLQQILLLSRYQKAGHKVITLCGGATGSIGDPRMTSERSMLSLDEVANNVISIKKTLERFINYDNGIMVNNYDWLSKHNVLTFLRDFGKHFNVNYMINKDIVASRLDKGISFTEFSYTILQAADFLHLYETYQCELQIGGSDQWGNITSGLELIRKKLGHEVKVYGITSPLIQKSDGTKFGKSEGANIWLDKEATSPYALYQYFLNSADSDVINFIKRLTFVEKDEILRLEECVKNEPFKREAQKVLAAEVTKIIHGEQSLKEALRISEAFFKGNIKELNKDELRSAIKQYTSVKVEDNLSLVDVLVQAQIASSKREARELIQNGSIQLNGDKVEDIIVSKENAIVDNYSIIKKGKKFYFVIEQ